MCLPCVFIARYLDEQKTENGKDKEQKQTNTDKENEEKGSFSDAGLGDANEIWFICSQNWYWEAF